MLVPGGDAVRWRASSEGVDQLPERIAEAPAARKAGAGIPVIPEGRGVFPVTPADPSVNRIVPARPGADRIVPERAGVNALVPQRSGAPLRPTDPDVGSVPPRRGETTPTAAPKADTRTAPATDARTAPATPPWRFLLGAVRRSAGVSHHRPPEPISARSLRDDGWHAGPTHNSDAASSTPFQLPQPWPDRPSRHDAAGHAAVSPAGIRPASPAAGSVLRSSSRTASSPQAVQSEPEPWRHPRVRTDWSPPRAVTDTTTGQTGPVIPAVGNWAPLPGRWPLARAVHDDWLRLDAARLDDEQRQV